MLPLKFCCDERKKQTADMSADCSACLSGAGLAHGFGTLLMAPLSRPVSSSPRDPDAGPGAAELPGGAQ